jgi:stalled ribosome rescue protein Dom34
MLKKFKQRNTEIKRTLIIVVSSLAGAVISYTLTRNWYEKRIYNMNQTAQEIGVLDKLIEYQNTH